MTHLPPHAPRTPSFPLQPQPQPGVTGSRHTRVNPAHWPARAPGGTTLTRFWTSHGAPDGDRTARARVSAAGDESQALGTT